MIPKPRPAVVHELPETGETVLCDLEGARLVVLNAVGAAVWSLLDGARSIDAIVDVIVETLGAERDVVRRDVEAFVASLAAQGLVDLP